MRRWLVVFPGSRVSNAAEFQPAIAELFVGMAGVARWANAFWMRRGGARIEASAAPTLAQSRPMD